MHQRNHVVGSSARADCTTSKSVDIAGLATDLVRQHHRHRLDHVAPPISRVDVRLLARMLPPQNRGDVTRWEKGAQA